MFAPSRIFVSTCALSGLLALASPAVAQRVSENAVSDADDAFGTSVGIERTGIYSQDDTRGFSPKDAGNVRLEGIYFDQVASLSGRLRQSSAIRVGFAADNFPFPAPTGVVDNRLRSMPKALGASIGLHRTGYWGNIAELDLRVPLVTDHIGLTGGVSRADFRVSDGSRTVSEDITVKATIRYAHTEFAPFISKRWFPTNDVPTLVYVDGDFLPKQPKTREYLGQKWADARFDNITYGATLKSRVTPDFVFRSGLFHSGGTRTRNFTELYAIKDASGAANHLMIAYPEMDNTSDSGEFQVVYLAERGKWKHRIYAGYRFRDRLTESGGSQSLFFNANAQYGVPDPQIEPEYEFDLDANPINSGRVKQSAIMLGYIAFVDGLGTINLGVQKGRYRARFLDAAAQEQSLSRANPWLYNAMLHVDISSKVALYVGTQRGLEDSGTAPESAANAFVQLPAAKTTQYEAGVHWSLGLGHLFINAFQIKKPYFSFDLAENFVQLGSVRHRGVEASFSGHWGKRFDLLAGAVLMEPRVSGIGRELGLVGSKPAGKPSLLLRADANYRTDILGGLTPTATVRFTGKRAVGARPLDPVAGGQLSVPASTRIDLGVRQKLDIGKVPTSVRAIVQNVFDSRTWDILAPNTLKMANRRRFTVSLTADF